MLFIRCPFHFLLGLSLFLSLSTENTYAVIGHKAVVAEIAHSKLLAIQGERERALKSLIALDLKIGEIPKHRELVTAARRVIASAFLTEQGQKAFEFGRSLMLEKPDVAIVKLTEALQLEGPSQISILQTLGHIHFRLRRLKEASEFYQKALSIDGTWGNLMTLDRLAILLGGLKPSPQGNDAAPTARSVDKEVRDISSLVKVYEFIQQKQWDKGQSELRKVSSPSNSSHTELIFAVVSVERALGGPWEAPLRSYLSGCRARWENQRAELALDPFVCFHLNEAEQWEKELETP